MPGISESFFANKNFTLVAAALAFLAAAVLLSVIFRFAFGRRLRLPRNGKARLPRLGTVDAFDLDGKRQLVIIRRDNVEHLLMIGGPNDLVIKSQIIRAESRKSRDFRESRIRDKELRETPGGVVWAPGPEDPPRRKMPVTPAAAIFAPDSGGTGGTAAEDTNPGISSSAWVPAPRPSAFASPPRRAAPVAAPSGQRLANPREAVRGRPDTLQRPEAATGAAKEFRRAPLATPFLRPLDQHRQVEATSAKSTPPLGTPEAPLAPPNAASLLPGTDEDSRLAGGSCGSWKRSRNRNANAGLYRSGTRRGRLDPGGLKSRSKPRGFGGGSGERQRRCAGSGNGQVARAQSRLEHDPHKNCRLPWTRSCNRTV